MHVGPPIAQGDGSTPNATSGLQASTRRTTTQSFEVHLKINGFLAASWKLAFDGGPDEDLAQMSNNLHQEVVLGEKSNC